MWLSSVLVTTWAASPLAKAREQCVAEASACDELRFLLATRWARGEVGAGPQESWRADELVLLEWWRRASAARPEPCLDEPAGCPFPLDFSAPTSTVEVLARSDTLISQLVRIPRDAPFPSDLPIRVEPLAAGASLTMEVRWGHTLAGDAVFDGVPDGVYVADEEEPGCLTRVLDPTGAPAAGSRVLSSSGVATAGPDGLAPSCGVDDTAVLGDALAVRADSWILQLVGGTRPRCSFEGAAPGWCDEVLLGHPERAKGQLDWGDPGPDGVIPVAQAPGRAFADHAPPGVDWRPFGPVCAAGGRVRRCPDPLTLRVVDDTGAPTTVSFGGPFSDLSGRLVVWPGFEPRGVHFGVERRGDRLVVHGRPRSGPERPAPRWSDWRVRDHEGMARAALAALAPDLPTNEGFELDPFPGGAVFSWGGRPRGLIGFADDRTAVVVGAGRADRSIVELP